MAAAPLGAAGIVALLGGVTLVVGGPGPVVWTVLVVATAGMLGLTGIGGALGDRAAARVDAPASGCAGTCAGCDLVAGCRPAATDTGCPDHAAGPRLTLPSPGCRSTRPIAQLCLASSGNVASSASGTPWRRSTRDQRFGPCPASTSSGRAGTTNQSPRPTSPAS